MAKSWARFSTDSLSFDLRLGLVPLAYLLLRLLWKKPERLALLMEVAVVVKELPGVTVLPIKLEAGLSLMRLYWTVGVRSSGVLGFASLALAYCSSPSGMKSVRRSISQDSLPRYFLRSITIDCHFPLSLSAFIWILFIVESAGPSAFSVVITTLPGFGLPTSSSMRHAPLVLTRTST